MPKVRNLLLLLVLASMLSGCGFLSIGGTVTERSVRTNEKVDSIIYIGTRSCLECMFSDWGWNSAGHPGPSCVIDFPFSFAFDTVFLPYTVPKTIWNFAKGHDAETNKSTSASELSSKVEKTESVPTSILGKPVDVWLIPLDGFPAEYSNELAKVFSKELGLSVRSTVHAGQTPKMFAPSGQIVAEHVRDELDVPLQRLYDVTPKTIYVALTRDDLNGEDGGTRFLFAMHYPAKRLSIVSIARMSNAFYGKTDEPLITKQRLYKLVKKSIGLQYFGYSRTTDLKSVMYSPVMSLDDLDAVGTAF